MTPEIKALDAEIALLETTLKGRRRSRRDALLAHHGVKEGDVVQTGYGPSLVRKVSLWDDGSIWSLKVSPYTKTGDWSQNIRHVRNGEWSKV